MKKILMIMTNIVTKNMQIYLREIGYELVEWRAPYQDDFEKNADALSNVLDDSYYGVFMYNFLPQFAQVCYDKSIYYITWIVDNPHFSLWSDTAKYITNRIFIFDKSQFEQMKRRGVDTVFYLPLGADIDSFENVDYGKKSFAADVAFVGSLYNESTRNMFQQIKYLPPYVKGYLNALLASQQKLPENIISKEIISAEVWQEIRKYVNFTQIDSYDFSFEEWFVSILQKEVTKRERCQAVTFLNEFFEFKLYTGSSIDFNPNLKKEGYIDYATEMPFVFRQSKVNINITLRSITTGIPLRALDIMACGGFLLSNYQKELAEYFVEDKECVFFYDLEDMVLKTDYYLKHEAERIKIVAAGHKKVKSEFSLKGQLRKMKDLLEANE